MSFATFALNCARLAHRFQLALQPRNPFLHPPAIYFQLRFAGAPRANAASLARQVVPHPRKTRQKILQLRKLDL